MEFVRAERMPVADHFLAVTAAACRPPSATACRPPSATGEVCELCFAYFADKAVLWRHARNRHRDDPRLACPEPGCGLRFFARAMCRAHRAEHAAGHSPPQPLTCELCGRPSRNTIAYDRHMAAAHPYARQAVCRACRTYHGDKASLAAHVRLRHANNNTTGGSGGADDDDRKRPAASKSPANAAVDEP